MNTKTTVRIKDKEMARSLANEFFQGLTSIKITGNGGTAEIFFDENPQEIINSIVDCIIKEDETLELECSKASNEQKEPIKREIVEKVNNMQQAEKGEIKATVEAEETKKEDAIVVQKELKQDEGRVAEKIVNDEISEIRLKVIPEIPELEKILADSPSFDEDVKRVADWLKLRKSMEEFKTILLTVSKKEDATWRYVKSVLATKNMKSDNCRIKIDQMLRHLEIQANAMLFLRKLIKGGSIYDKTKKVEIETAGMRLKEIPEIPQISKIIAESETFDEDAEKVSKWLELDEKWGELLVNLLKAATLVDKITWDFLAKCLESRGYKCGSYEKSLGRKAIKKGLEEKNISMNLSKFIEALVKGRDIKKVETGPKTNKEDIGEIKVPKQEQDTKETDKTKQHLITRKGNEVTIWCTPHITFNVDPNQTEENMVNLVLTTMGLRRFKLKPENSEKESDNIRKIIFEVCNAAAKMNLEENDIKAVCEKTQIPEDCSSKKANMLISQFINDFAKRNNIEHAIKVIDFLSDLQKVIIFKDETDL